MRPLTSGLVVVGLTAALSATACGTASAAPSENGACVQAGQSTLKSLDLHQAAARRDIDYSTLANPTSGPIFASLPAGSYLSLGQVVKLHTTSPQLFAWC